jgi:hypothetical protein
MGIIATAIHPNIVPAHCIPRFSIICLEKSGNAQPIAERKIVFAAMVDAALSLILVTSMMCER